MSTSRRCLFSLLSIPLLSTLLFVADGRRASAADSPADALATARQVDQLIARELQASGVPLADRAGAEDLLRRVTLDLTGGLPSPQEVTLFGLDPDPRKLERLVERLLDSEGYATNWAQYWRDVIFSRATDPRARLGQPAFQSWMTAQLQDNVGWDDITTALLTATGDVTENGDTALIFAHQGMAEELAAETSRIFLGIQLQCANCHDHPTDRWKRDQFHELAAFFPRVRVRPVQDGERRSFEVTSFDRAPRERPDPERIFGMLDRNRDGKLTKAEVAQSRLKNLFERALQNGDSDGDGALSKEEFAKLPAPGGNGRNTNTEHFMPDLSDPTSQGKKTEPAFFVNVSSGRVRTGLDDAERRNVLATYVTSKSNPWFARAFVNRIWSEMLGEGFYMPVDDIGPQRTARFPDVLDLLSQGFANNNYDVKWLFRAIANTQTYQRQIRAKDAGDQGLPFASAVPTRLRADQLYTSLLSVLGVAESEGQPLGEGGGAQMMVRRARSPRFAFSQLFAFDPSTPQEDLTGNIPQALFLMNSEVVHNLIRSSGRTRLSQVLNDYPNDEDALRELYLIVLSREPSAGELKSCQGYITKVGKRGEAFEDIEWSLLNSSEFLSKR